jgi:hypothetical protein
MQQATTQPVPFFQRYINLVQAPTAADAVRKYSAQILEFYTSLPEEKAQYSYGEGKWTLLEVMQHIIDSERVFSYRAMRIARNDATPLPGFDQDSFVENSQAGGRSLSSLKEEFTLLRSATDIFVLTLTESQLANAGTTNNTPITANAIVYIIYGHLLHHINVIKQRYL